MIWRELEMDEIALTISSSFLMPTALEGLAQYTDFQQPQE